MHTISRIDEYEADTQQCVLINDMWSSHLSHPVHCQTRYSRTEMELSSKPEVQVDSISSPPVINTVLPTLLASRRPRSSIIMRPPNSSYHFHTATIASFFIGKGRVRRSLDHPIHLCAFLWEGAGIRGRKQIKKLESFQPLISLRQLALLPKEITILQSLLYRTYPEC